MNDIETKKEEAMNTQNESTNPKKSKTKWIVLLLAIVIAGIIYVAISVLGLGGGGSVAAKVNGEKILQSELQQRFDQEKQRAVSQGVDTSGSEISEQVKSKILQELINTKLLLQAAIESGIKIDTDAIDSEIASIEQQIGGREALLAQLSEIGIDEDKFKKEVLNQLILRQYLSENIDLSSITATEEDISLAYKQISSTSDNVPPLSEIKEQIKKQIVLEKQQKLLNVLIESLKAKAKVKIF